MGVGVGVGEEEDEEEANSGGSTRMASRERGIGARFAERVGGTDERRKGRRKKMGMVVSCIMRVGRLSNQDGIPISRDPIPLSYVFGSRRSGFRFYSCNSILKVARDGTQPIIRREKTTASVDNDTLGPLNASNALNAPKVKVKGQRSKVKGPRANVSLPWTCYQAGSGG